MLKKMKLLPLFLGLFAGQLSAQTTAPDTSAAHTTKTLLGAVRPRLTFLGLAVAPEFQYLGAVGGYGTGYGASAMLVFNRRWSVGAAAFGSDDIAPKLSNNAGLNLRYGAAGGVFEFTPRPQGLVHLSFPLFVGAGMASLDSARLENDFSGEGHHGDGDGLERGDGEGENAFFVAQPNVRAEMNLTRFARVYVGAGYRIAAGGSVSYPNASGGTSSLGASQLSGLSLQAGVKVGLFNYRLSRLSGGRSWFRKGKK